MLTETSLGMERVFGIAEKNPQPWSDIELTEEEEHEALNQARREKYYADIDRREREEWRERKKMLQGVWDIGMTYKYARYRAIRYCGFSHDEGVDGKPVFMVDDANREVMKALCLYFMNSPEFEQLQVKNEHGELVPANWKLNKGIALVGGVGRGKTKMMQMFAINKRQIFEVLNAQELSALFVRKGEQGGYEMIEQFRSIHRPDLIKHEDNLWQERVGLCIDDVGTEDEKVSFGNRSNVISEILAARYGNTKLLKCMTHITTNLGINGIKQKYGERIQSRVLEMFNIIELPGGDRRQQSLPAL